MHPQGTRSSHCAVAAAVFCGGDCVRLNMLQFVLKRICCEQFLRLNGLIMHNLSAENGLLG